MGYFIPTTSNLFKNLKRDQILPLEKQGIPIREIKSTCQKLEIQCAEMYEAMKKLNSRLGCKCISHVFLCAPCLEASNTFDKIITKYYPDPSNE